jgi:putative membrane protein
LINGFAFYAAVQLVPGITEVTANPVNYLVLALIFGLLNALVKPILTLLTCPFILVTLGLFTLVINTGLFYLTGWLGQQFDYGFYVSGFWAALLGAIVVSLIGMLGEAIFRDELKDRRKRKNN